VVAQRHCCRQLNALAIGLANIEYPTGECIGHTVIVVIDVHVVDHLHVFVFIHEEDDVEAAATIEVVRFKAELIRICRFRLERAGQITVSLRNGLVGRHRT